MHTTDIGHPRFIREKATCWKNAKANRGTAEHHSTLNPPFLPSNAECCRISRKTNIFIRATTNSIFTTAHHIRPESHVWCSTAHSKMSASSTFCLSGGCYTYAAQPVGFFLFPGLKCTRNSIVGIHSAPQYRKLCERGGKAKAYNTCIAPQAAYRSCRSAVHVTGWRTAYKP